MGLDAMRIRVQIRRFLVISTRTSYKSARKHPFLVGMVCFSIFLYRSFPFLFSLLVSVSPVLVCTAVLLGTLLSFGEPNIPEIEKEEEVTHEISSLKAGVLGDATVVVDKDGDFFVESFVGKRKDTAGEAIGEESWEKNRVSKIEEEDSLGDYVPLIDESSREIQFEKQVIDQVEREFDDLELEKKMGIYEEKQGIKEVLSNGEAAQSHYSRVQNVRNETLQVEYDKSSGESIEAEKGDRLDSQHSSWKRANGGGGDDDDEEEEEEEDEDASDSGSDGAESFSPDASMADIIPMLDELHPLLNEETPLLHEASPQPDMSRDGFDAGSEQSHESKESSVESEEDIENLADREEDGDDDNENEEDEGTQGGKEDESKSAIKWTEDDQKNLMDLGTLELERNQRLESLIARRRARRNLRSMAEKNLIDLDGADLPINVPPISTTRRNPFDLPYDSYDDVPGSAPSILLPRRNPFDLPYDSNEEKPDLKGDSFQQEFSSLQHREPFFRRHESFSVGPSVLGGPKQERQDLRWKPYFVPERYATEGTSYATFQRQLSGASESKLSSAPDTESVSSVVEEEDKKLNEEDVSQETDMISNLDHASILVERGSLSSEDIDSADIENVERRDVHRDGDEITFGDVENHQELDSRLSTLGGATSVELNTREILLRMEPGEEGYSSGSSLSSLSEVDEKISDVKNGSMSPEPRNAQIEESHISTHASDFHFMSEVADENQHREPVLEPRSNHTAESGIVMQTSFDSDFHFTSGVEYENRCMEPVLEPTGSDIGDSSISMQASLNSDSQLLSEVEDNDKKKKPDLEPRRNHVRESGTSTQTSLNSDFHFTSELVDDNQHKEPVYDSSPQPVDKLLSLLSISSDAQGETSEMGSPPASVEFSNEVSEMHIENMGKDDSGYKEMHEDSPDEHSLDENESRLRELTEIDNDVMKVGLSGDDLNLDDQNSKNGLIKSELAVDSPLSSSNNGSIKDSLTYLEERSNHELDQLQSAGLNAETIVGLHQDVIGNSDCTSSSNHVASEETILHALEEEHPSVAVDVSADSKLSYLESEAVEDHAVGTEGILQLEQKQVPLSSFDSEIHVNGFQAMHEKFDSVTSSSEHMPSNDSSGSTNEEGQPALVAEQVLEARLDVSSTEIKHVEEHSLRKDETLQFKQDYEHSSSSDAEIGADLLQDADIKLVSSGFSHQHVPSEARSLFELEKQMSWSDTSVVEPSIDDNDESQEPSVTLVESTVEVNIAKDVNVPEVFDHETSESISVPPESLEYKSRVDEFDFKDNILDKIVYEESGHVLEHPSYSEETHKSSVSKENINEDEDEIKEIDEGLLSELDTVGDFRVKEVVGELLHDEQMTQKSGVLSPDYDLLPRDLIMAEIKPELPLLEVKSVTDIELAFKQLLEGVNVEEVILPGMIEDQPIADESKGPGETNSDLRVVEAKSLEDIHVAMKQAAEENIEEMSKPSEINIAGSSNSTEELPVLEVRTINDIDLAFKQLNEGMDVEEVILPSAIEQHLAVDESEDPRQSSFDLRVVEARSLEDLHIAMKHASEENIEDMSKPSGLKEGPAEANEVGSSSSTKELPVLEVRTIDDIDLVFKELNNGIDVEKLENLVVNESRDPQQSSSDLQVLEASSLEDDHIAMKQVSEVKIEELPKSDPTTENVLRTSEVNEISPAKDINSSTVEATEADFTQESGSATVDFDAQETSTMAPQESKHALDEKSGI